MNTLSPARRNAQIFAQMESMSIEDRLAICVVITPDYERYVPLWKKCINEAYPQYEPVVIRVDLADCETGDKMAALRFTDYEDILSKYPYVLITDVDILIMREQRSIVKQHVFYMIKEGLSGYSNMMTDENRMAGVHFITQEWWDLTRKARDKYREIIKAMPSSWGIDEPILAKIVQESGLKVVKGMCLWAIHGIHMGALKRVKYVDMDGDKGLFLEKLLKEAGLGPISSFESQAEMFEALVDNTK